MKKFYWAVYTSLFLLSCRNAAPDLNGAGKVKAEDFLKAFNAIKLQRAIADSSLHNISDSTLISTTIFTQFVADSALTKFSSALNGSYVIHPAGIIHKKESDFLLITFSSGKKIQLGVFALNDKHQFLSSIYLLDNFKKDNYTHSVSITEEP